MIVHNDGRPIIGVTTDVDGEYVRLRQNYCDIVENSGGIPVLLPPASSIEAYASLVHGLLIPGGADLNPSYYGEDALEDVHFVSGARSDFEMSMLRKLITLNKPVLGICYGMQLMNVYFGGSLYQDIDVQLPVAINHKNGYHTVVITENRFLMPGVFSVNSSHHQAIKTVGEGLSSIARADDHIIEAICREDLRFIVGVQWHPERMPKDDISRNLFQLFIQAAHVGR